jgi:tetratricopeptide (TPR) repeat protein
MRAMGGAGGPERPPALTSGAEFTSAPRTTRGVYWLVTLSIAPLLAGLLEAGLRLGGFGHPAAFLADDTVGGQAVLRDNPHFARRFFPPPLYRSPRPFAAVRAKPPSTYRVLVLGESAALGDPAPAFGFARILEVMLKERYPDRRIEVLNAAVTAINSHAIREIADDCVRLQPDLFLIYMGNNEVVGPYGVGTVFHPLRQSLAATRAHLWIKRSRIGQLADRWGRGARRDEGPQRWEGMAMFRGHEVEAAHPGLAEVRAHFRRNLEDVLDAAGRAGAQVLLATLATNLRDQAPFAGEAAVQAYRQALDLDAQGKHAEAYERFVRARDLDTLRFRADSAVNDAIRDVAAARRVALLDVEAAFRRESPHGIPGDELLFEHVHMTFEGNHLIAKEALQHIASLLPAPGAAEALSPEECARRLGFTPWHRHKLLGEVIERVRRPPFAGQAANAERRARLEQQARALRQLLAPSALAEAVAAASAVAAPRADWQLHEGLAELLEAAGEVEPAVAEWQRVVAAVPHNHEAHGRLGALLVAAGRPDEALARFQHALALRPDVADPYNNLGAFHAGQGRWAEAEAAYRRALEIDPGSHQALANLASARAAQGRVEEAKLLYRQAAGRPIDSAQTRYELAVLAQALGLPDEVEAHLRAALEIEPAHLEACELLAAVWRQSGRADEAVAYFEALAGRAPSPAAHRMLAELLEDSDRVLDAAGHYRRALALDPALPGARSGLAWILATSPDPRLRNPSEAIALAEEACRVTRQRDPETLNALAAAYAAAQRFADAARTARQAVEAALASGQPELAAHLNRLAEAYAAGRSFPEGGPLRQ